MATHEPMLILMEGGTFGSRKRQPRHRAVEKNEYSLHSIENVDLRGFYLELRL